MSKQFDSINNFVETFEKTQKQLTQKLNEANKLINNLDPLHKKALLDISNTIKKGVTEIDPSKVVDAMKQASTIYGNNTNNK